MASNQSTVDGAELHRVENRSVSGSLDEFIPTFHDEAGTRPYGWVCEHCGGEDVCADTMGRLVCNDCHNSSPPTQWDSAYL